MKKKDDVINRYKAIIALKGAGNFKKMIESLHTSVISDKTYRLSEVTLPSYLWAVKHGGGVTTLISSFAEYLYATKAIEFCGTATFFEFKLEYVHPGEHLSEIARLDNTISDYAGHNNNYKGIIGIDITAWIDHEHEDHFQQLLEYMAHIKSKCPIVFYAYTDKPLDNMKMAISATMRVEYMTIEYPTASEVVELLEEQFIMDKGISLPPDAREQLIEIIKTLIADECFYGFKTINQIKEDILYKVLITESVSKKQISTKLLSEYKRNSLLTKRTKPQAKAKRIGFSTEVRENSI